eukprot:5056518-Pyramimonas_sp.AAC.1
MPMPPFVVAVVCPSSSTVRHCPHRKHYVPIRRLKDGDDPACQQRTSNLRPVQPGQPPDVGEHNAHSLHKH